MDVIDRIATSLEEIRREYAPDPRLTVFEVEVMREGEGEGVAVFGATSDPAAAEAVHRSLGLMEEGVAIRDELQRLPTAEVADRPYGIVASAIAPFLAAPHVSAAIVTQALLGDRLAVLRARGRWLQCRAEDGYLGWVHRGYLELVSEAEAVEWEVASGGEMCMSLGATVIGADGALLARLPWGARVIREAATEIRLPGGARGRVWGDLVPLTGLADRFPPDGIALVATAAEWMAAPYLWGGVTPAGVDCSGLAQAVCRAHGVGLPRDSDLQAEVGERLEAGDDFSALTPGDLLFFAEEPNRVSHVAISLGGSRIIHASLGNGGVGRNDLVGASGFEQELRRLFVGARRVISLA